MKYCSLGNNCTSSTILKRTKLKTESYPFDWIFSSDEMVRHCIEDGFKTFLDKSEYSTNFADYSICEHKFYSKIVENYQNDESKDDVIFNHHNPLLFYQDYAYFERCVKRFKDLLASDENKVFVKIHLNMTSDDESINLSEAISLCEVLSKHTTNYKLIVLHVCPMGQGGHEIKYNEDNLIFCNLYTITKSTGIDFEDIKESLYLDSVFLYLSRLIKWDKNQ